MSINQKDKDTVTCPHCHKEFNLSTAMQEQVELQVEQRLRTEYDDLYKKKVDSYKTTIDAELLKSQALANEKDKALAQKDAELSNAKKIQMDYAILQDKFNENLQNTKFQIDMAKNAAANEVREKMNADFAHLRKSDEERIKKEADTQAKMQLEIELAKKDLQQKSEFELQLNNKELKHSLEIKELQQKFEQTQKQLDNANRTLNQGSMQQQGEAQERLLSEILKEQFPSDKFNAKTPGKEESDIEQHIIADNGVECGIILYESKNTKSFNKQWIDKLKLDGRTANANELILVTRTMPEHNKHLHRVDGVWICPIAELRLTATTLRYGMIEANKVAISQQHRKEKMELLYDYMVGSEFHYYMETIIKGITNIRDSYNQEKMKLQKLWKQREKEFENIIDCATTFVGAIRGISDTIPEIQILELPDDNDYLLEN
ncbi:MAG: DUF2130 domain-containing protein [Ignavibacteria bacterium]|jgi:hypothetical protein|nr:DUF2130 domain-containing protein [Ignavibacteria bacterium]